MISRLSGFFILGISALIIFSNCGRFSPLEPSPPTDQPRAQSEVSNPHRLFSTGQIYFDSVSGSFSLIPSRISSSHWNATKLLEVKPCDDCVSLTDIQSLGNYEWLVEVTVRHPMDSGKDVFTAFDVRGIIMFPATGSFPGLGLTWPDPIMNEGGLLNPDGYTTNFNPLIFHDMGPYKGYYEGKFSTAIPPESMLNPYKDFTVSSKRRHLKAGSSAHATFQMMLPSHDLKLGYAIDACWEMPDVNPPQNIPDDFGLSANMQEPFALLVDPVKNTMWYQSSVSYGGELKMDIKVYDWQGPKPVSDGGSVNAFHFDIPELLTETNVAPDSYETGYDPLPYALYSFTFTPQLQKAGTFPYLVAVEDIKPGLLSKTKATAYQIGKIEVAQVPVNQPPIADPSATHPTEGYVPLTVQLDPSLSYDSDGTIVSYEWDIDNDGDYELTTYSPTPIGWLFDSIGEFIVHLRVTDNEGAADIGQIVITVWPPGNELPVADLSLTTPKSGPAPLDVSLDGSESYDPDGTIAKWEWDIDGDGDYEYVLTSDNSIIYTYEEIGDFQLVLRVTDNLGATDTDQTTIHVE